MEEDHQKSPPAASPLLSSHGDDFDECLLQIEGLTVQQEEQQKQQQMRQQALAAMQAGIEDELRPQRQQLHDQALAALQQEVATNVQVLTHPPTCCVLLTHPHMLCLADTTSR